MNWIELGKPMEIVKYNDKLVQFKCSDCIEFLRELPNESVDVITTDPPYSGMNQKLKLGKGRIVGQYNTKGTEHGKWFAEFEDSDKNYRMLLSEMKRVLNKTTGHLYIMFDSFSLLTLGSLVREYFSVKNLITWDKVNIGMGHYFRRRHEYILFATNGNNRKLNSKAIPDVWRIKRLHKTEYPTQKPVELFEQMLIASAKPEFVVCDPFMGTGSSALAAMKQDCNFVGADISTKAIEISIRRIKNVE
jgi:site-specific DNA-methyltransferase (adenine-specific)